MKLDPRIKSLSDILTCFDIERANQFIGKNGYFADSIACYQCLSDGVYGTLTKFEDGEYPFKEGKIKEGKGGNWRHFIPECLVKPKEKQYRPFKDTNEFFIKTNFEEGDLIHIRSKDKIEFWVMLVGWLNNGIMLGTENFTFDKLFDKFELWDGEDKFIPFGVEVTE